MRRHGLTLFFLVAAIGLVAFLWFDRDRVPTGERARRANNVFSAWRRDELTKIEIAHDGETIVLEREKKEEGLWRMTSPLAERADVASVERLLTTLEFATVQRKVADEGERAEDAKTLGFDAPRAHGALTMGGLVIRFVLGGASPRPAGSGYLTVDKELPFVVSKELVDALLTRSDTYRDRSVVPYLSLDLAGFEVVSGSGVTKEGGFAIDRLDPRSFKVRGSGLLASRSAVDKVWATLAEIRAESFPKDADADALTRSPALTIRMTPKDAAKPAAELVLGDKCPGHGDDVVVLRKQPTRLAACAPRGIIEALRSVTPDSLVDRRPFAFRPDEIEELRMEWIGSPIEPDLFDEADAGPPPHAIEIARRGTGFHQREPVDKELSTEEADAASELLGRFDLAAGESVTRGGAAFTAIGRVRIRSGDLDEVVEIASPTLIRRVRDDARLVVAPAVVRRLEPRRTSFRPRTLFGQEKPRHVSRMAVRCGTAQDFVDDGSGLKLVTPAGYETDGSVTQLVDAVFRGKLLSWVADADDGTFGLPPAPAADPSSCRLVFSYEDGNSPTTIHLGAEGEGGIYGLVEGHPEVFSAPLSLKTLASKIYVSHAALRVEANRIESVKVTTHSAIAGQVLNDPAVLRDAASSLFADRVVALFPSGAAALASVGTPDLEVTIALAEGGPPKRVVCGKIDGAPPARRCATPAVGAVFEVRSSTFARFFVSASDAGAADAGAGEPSDAGDAGARRRPSAGDLICQRHAPR